MANLENMLIGVVLFSVVIITVLSMVNDFNRGYEGIIDQNISNSAFNRTYDKINETFDVTQDMKDDVLGDQISSDDLQGSMAKGPFKAVRKMGSLFTLLTIFIQELAEELKIPPWFITLAFVILSIGIVFGLVRIVKGFIG